LGFEGDSLPADVEELGGGGEARRRPGGGCRSLREGRWLGPHEGER
jgi:hypothetical protein